VTLRSLGTRGSIGRGIVGRGIVGRGISRGCISGSCGWRGHEVSALVELE
jgi:hypothetical protein